MPTGKNIGRAVYGAWRLFLLDSQGIHWFELTIRGFWQSFFAAVLIAPFYFIGALIDAGASFEEGDLYTNLFVKSAAYILNWITFPIVMVFICRIFGLTKTYIPYIIALNWSSIIQTIIFFPVVALGASELLTTSAIAPLLIVITMGLLFFYQWYIARSILAVSTLGAVVLVLLDLLITIFILRSSDNLLILSVS